MSETKKIKAGEKLTITLTRQQSVTVMVGLDNDTTDAEVRDLIANDPDLLMPNESSLEGLDWSGEEVYLMKVSAVDEDGETITIFDADESDEG